MRRRLPAAGYTFGVLFVALMGSMLVSPARFVARASLAPSEGEAFPLTLRTELEALCASPALAEEVARASSETAAQVEAEVHETALALRVEAGSDAAAERGLERALALLLERFEPIPAEAPIEVAPVTSDLDAAREPLREAEARIEACARRLTSLREQAVPEATDEPALRAARQELAGRIREDEIALSGLHAQLETWNERVSELDQQVEAEARVAYQVDQDRRRDEARREALARRLEQAQRTPQPPVDERPTQAPTEPAITARPARSTRLEQLERELERMRARRTDRHPAVRRLLREIEAERRLIPAPEPAPAGVEPSRHGPAEAPWERPIERGASEPIADGDPDPAAAAPQAWRQQAPSYPSLVAARNAEADSLRAIRVLEEQLEARRRDLATHDERLHRQEPLRAEIEALERQLAELQRTRDAQRVAVEQLEAAAAPITKPGKPGRPGLVVAAREHAGNEQAGPVSMGKGLLLALLLALGVALGLEWRDRSFHDPQELADMLGLPVLGIIPHGRS